MGAQGQQLSLFRETDHTQQRALRQEALEWSPSKRGILEQCPRRYYYQYYGAAARTAIRECLKQQLQFYRKLSNSWMQSGILLHLKIRQSFRPFQYEGSDALEEVVRDVRQRWEKTREASVQFAKSGNIQEATGKVLLLEYIFAHPGADKMWAAAGERLEKALTGFLTLPDLEQFRRGGVRPRSAIEQRVTVEGPGFRMRGQFDLAWSENGRVTVADWKSGSRRGGDSDLQLLAYALAAQKHFNCQLGDLDLYRVELDSGKVIRQEVNAQEVARAKARIAQDTSVMMDLDKYGQQGIAEAFTPTGSPRVCRLCPYQKICPGNEA